MEGEQFWASVLKKWSEAADNVVKLKKELAELQTQCNEHHARAHAFLQESEQVVNQPSIVHISGGEFEQEHVVKSPPGKQTNASLEHINPEINELKEQLRASSCHVKTLKIQNATLVLEKSQITQERDTSSARGTELQRQLDDAKRDNEHLRAQNAALLQEASRSSRQLDTVFAENSKHKANLNDSSRERELLNQTVIMRDAEIQESRLQIESLKLKLLQQREQVGSLPALVDRDLQDKFLRQEKEIDNLKCSAKMEAEKKENLHQELTATRLSLQKAKDSNKALLDTIKKLQDMVRNVVLPAQPTLSKMPSTLSNAPASTPAGPRKVSFSTSNATSLPTRLLLRSPTNAPPLAGSSGTERKQGILNRNPNDETIIVRDEPSGSRLAYGTPVPNTRRKALADFPQIIPDIIDDDSEKTLFTRGFLKTALGGSNQPLIVKIAQTTPLSEKFQISSFLCPNLDLNPWCPSAPGQHGYIFVGLGEEKDTFKAPQIRNVFVGIMGRRRKGPRTFKYVGVYSAVRVDPLSVQEWKTLSSDVKDAYSSKTKEKNKDSRSIAQIHSAYDAGELLVPCVQLNCIDFNEDLYARLLAANSTPLSPSGSSTPQSSPAKRRRDDDEDDFVHYPRRSSRKSH